MARIKVTTFGGILPSQNPRNLPTESAQIAENLDLRFGDFRPLKQPGASVATVAAGTQSIFRTPSGTWLSSLTDTNYVNAQVFDTEFERVYLTGRSAYPEAWENGVYRRLGVPAPTLAPSLSVVVNDEFTDDEATAAQPAILAAIKAAITDNTSNSFLGAAPTPTTPPAITNPTGDALYDFVQLHLRFNGTAGSSVITDSSNANRAIVPGGVTLASGAILTGGEQYGAFSRTTQNLSVPLITAESTTQWAVEFYMQCDSALTHIGTSFQSGAVSSFYFMTSSSTSTSRVIFSRSRRSTDDTARTAALPSTIPANTTAKVQLINSFTSLSVYVDGVLVQSFSPQGLNLRYIGWTATNGPSGLDGKLDEFRVTVGAARTASATVAIWPGSLAAGSQDGFFLSHGTSTTPPLPTTKSGQWAWLVPMYLDGGEYKITNVANEYLRNSGFGGVRVTYSGSEYWAVPVSYQAQSKTVDYAGLLVDLKAIQSPAGGQLLSDDNAATLAQVIADTADTTKEPVSRYLADITSKQSILDSQLKSTDTGAGRATSVLSASLSLESAVTEAERYFNLFTTNIDAYVLDLYNTYVFGSIPTTTSRQIETRVYVYTYVTDWGEESAPSPASALVELDQNDSVSVTVFAPPSGRNIVGWRLYRSSTTALGAAYQLVADKAAAQAVLSGTSFDYFSTSSLLYSDAKRQEELEEALQTLTWLEPPANLIGLVGLPNGILAGFFGKTVCFSEPYAPYAWPLEYQLTTEHNIVGLGVFGQTLVVLTEGWPYYASGADSASMSLQKIEQPQSCISKRSIASMDNGVAYASPDGMCFAGPNGIEVVSQGAFSKEDWQTAVGAAPLGAFYEGRYLIINTDPVGD